MPEPDHVSPQEFVAKANDWEDRGVQIVGGCCRMELETEMTLLQRAVEQAGQRFWRACTRRALHVDGTAAYAWGI